jgi:hypothetical protein
MFLPDGSRLGNQTFDKSINLMQNLTEQLEMLCDLRLRDNLPDISIWDDFRYGIATIGFLEKTDTSRSIWKLGR